MPAPAAHKVIYEQPLNERIRTFLRVEFLYRQTRHHLGGETLWDSRAAVMSLLDFFGIVLRTDLRSEVMKELDRHMQTLARYEEQPGVDVSQLNELLDEIESLIDQIHNLPRQPGNDLRGHELLAAIGQRSGIPGGTCDFDLPAYHYWLSQPGERRSHDLSQWLEGLDPVVRAIRLILRLTRTSANFRVERAEKGLYHSSLSAEEASCQMIRVALPADSPFYAEISGGRHRFTVRLYAVADLRERPRQTQDDVEFELACCII